LAFAGMGYFSGTRFSHWNSGIYICLVFRY
jgi:hypothetical protein